MAHHTITLNYNNNTFRPDRDPVKVKPNDTISFQLGQAPPNSKFDIKFEHANLFSAPGASDNSRITVRTPARSKYHCKLFDAAGAVLSESNEKNAGGMIEPDTAVTEN